MEKTKKVKLYLCDLVHNYLNVGSYMFPLNIGYIGAYTKKVFPEDFEIRLFKYPNDFLKAFKDEPADVVGFSNYTWNSDLNNRVAQWIKSISPKTAVIFGGPNIDYFPKGLERFFTNHPTTDFYVLYQGEIGFSNILKRLLEKDFDLAVAKTEAIDGVVFKEKGQVVQGKVLPRIKDLIQIPSPYLSGMLDQFFETNLIPIMESNRGCPYSCTYCCQAYSSFNQIEFYPLERVKQELDYIALHVKNTNILNFADSNFGIVERDMEIARHIAKLSEEKGYPHKFNVNWAKNQPRLFELNKILKNINLDVSLQSLDETVLKNIKRQNIDISIFKNIIDEINKAGGISGTEIILALPGETKQSHMETLRKLFNWNVSYIICYNCLILDGSEMSVQRENGEFEFKTKFRLIDNSFGKYGDMVSFEYEEGVRSTSTLSEEEILFFRPVHWLIQFLWTYRFYYDLLKYLQFQGINPLDFIVKLIENIDSKAPQKIKEVFKEFREDARKEWFDSPEAMREHYSKPENFEWLAKGNYGKMNSKYIFKVLVEARKELEEYIYDTASELCGSKKEIIRNLVDFHSAAIIDFSKDWDELSKKQELSLKHDILAWRESRYGKNLDDFSSDIRLVFYIPEEQKKALQVLMKQYQHQNRNATLRKMSEFMDIRDFFRKAEKI
jgi:radical SAM superfamily enzyme YgiQ (UPF0313 family)